MNILRRLPLSRLLLLCALVVAVGVSASALALAVGSGPTPPAKPLAQAIHDALAAPAVEGVSAEVQLTDHLLEGAELEAGGPGAGELSTSPLMTGASGRLWVAKDGRVRLELQAEKGDMQIIYDGHTLQIYDASTNTLYRYTPPAREGDRENGAREHGQPPSVKDIEDAIAHAREHANVSGATPTDVAGQAAYTVRVSPLEGGSLIRGGEVSWDAVHGVPLRAAVYSAKDPSPVIELAARSISYGPVADSVFDLALPPGVKVQEIKSSQSTGKEPSTPSGNAKLSSRGHGITTIAILKSEAKAGSHASSPVEGLPKVKINGASASELSTALGTLLSFEREGVRYVLVGAVPPSAVEAVARGL